MVVPEGTFAHEEGTFASAEGIGGEPGAVDVVDTGAAERVASVAVGKQAGGIAFWKTEAAAQGGR